MLPPNMNPEPMIVIVRRQFQERFIQTRYGQKEKQHGPGAGIIQTTVCLAA